MRKGHKKRQTIQASEYGKLGRGNKKENEDEDEEHPY
jgi:hypothetical protein